MFQVAVSVADVPSRLDRVWKLDRPTVNDIGSATQKCPNEVTHAHRIHHRSRAIPIERGIRTLGICARISSL